MTVKRYDFYTMAGGTTTMTLEELTRRLHHEADVIRRVLQEHGGRAQITIREYDACECCEQEIKRKGCDDVFPGPNVGEVEIEHCTVCDDTRFTLRYGIQIAGVPQIVREPCYKCNAGGVAR